MYNSNNTYVSNSEQWRRHRAKLSWARGMYVQIPGGEVVRKVGWEVVEV